MQGSGMCQHTPCMFARFCVGFSEAFAETASSHGRFLDVHSNACEAPTVVGIQSSFYNFNDILLHRAVLGNTCFGPFLGFYAPPW